MNKIGFSGIASTGKTTLARAFAAKCQFLVDNIKLVDEYATDYLSKFESLEFTLWEQKLFIIEQLKKEKLIPSKTQLIVTDSPLTTGFMYCVDIFNRSPKTTKDIMLMTDLFSFLLENNNYDIIFHLEPVIKPVDNGIRPKLHFEPDWRREKNDLVKSVLKMFPPKQTFYVETEDFEERIDFCIDKFQKFLG